MLSQNRNFLVSVLVLIALAWIAKLVWNASIPYRSNRLAAKIKHQADRGETFEAQKLLEKSLSGLTLADEYSCKVRMVLNGWYEGPSREQILDDARHRGVSDDSLLTWKMEFALDEAFRVPFHGFFPESNARLKRLAQEAQHRRSDDSLTLLVRAMSHFQFREFAQCRKLADLAQSRWPESFRILLLKGRCLVAQGRYDSALKVFPEPDSVLREDYNPLYPSAKYRRRASLIYQWFGAAKVGAHGVNARKFAWDVKACGRHTYEPWSDYASSACEIHSMLLPTDTAGKCLKIPFDLDDSDDFDTIQKLSNIFGGPPKCPEWADPARSDESLRKPKTLQDQTDCLFGTGDSTKDAKCPE